MANIRVDLKSGLLNGQSVVFKAPCDCTKITGLVAYYHDGEEVVNKSFTFKDAHGNNVAGLGNLFKQGAYVKVILDTTKNAAYIQNADNNSYVATIAAKVEELESNTHIAYTDVTLSGSPTVVKIDLPAGFTLDNCIIIASYYTEGDVVYCNQISGNKSDGSVQRNTPWYQKISAANQYALWVTSFGTGVTYNGVLRVYFRRIS